MNQSLLPLSNRIAWMMEPVCNPFFQLISTGLGTSNDIENINELAWLAVLFPLGFTWLCSCLFDAFILIILLGGRGH